MRAADTGLVLVQADIQPLTADGLNATLETACLQDLNRGKPVGSDWWMSARPPCLSVVSSPVTVVVVWVAVVVAVGLQCLSAVRSPVTVNGEGNFRNRRGCLQCLSAVRSPVT